MAYVFYKFHICFFLCVIKKNKHTAYMCEKTLIHNVRTRTTGQRFV